MSGINIENKEEPDLVDNSVKNQVGHQQTLEDPDSSTKSDENAMPLPQQEEDIIKKKYGGIIPKKLPLISKDHERAFFDSADWALGKQGAKPKGPLEALRPKLQPTQQHARSRRSAYAPADGCEDESHNSTPSEDQGCTSESDGDNSNKNSTVEANSHD